VMIGAASARGMSKPTPTVLILVGIGLGLFGLRIFGIESLQYKWVLAISICLVAYGAYLYASLRGANATKQSRSARRFLRARCAARASRCRACTRVSACVFEL